MRNMRKIQQAQKVRGTNPQKALIQKLKSVPAGSNSIGD